MPKNMKYDATTKRAGAPKKKMKSNQDGGSMTAKDPAAAGKEMIANQKGAAKYKKGPAQKKPDANKNGVPDYAEDGVGASRMGYSQKFGPGRMNGYDASAKKVMDVMTYGAGKYMAEGPAQSRSGLLLGEKIKKGTADDTYNMINPNTTRTQEENVNPNTGSSSTTTSFESSDLPGYKANVTETYNTISTNTSNYPNSRYTIRTDNKQSMNNAANSNLRNPSRGRGFQQTYSDGEFVRDTNTGRQLFDVPKKGDRNKTTNIKLYNKHLKDSVSSRNERVRKQINNAARQEKSEIAKRIQNQRGR